MGPELTTDWAGWMLGFTFIPQVFPAAEEMKASKLERSKAGSRSAKNTDSNDF